MGDLIFILINLSIPVFLLALGLTVGKLVERRHFLRLAATEMELEDVLSSTVRTYPGGVDVRREPTLVAANVVISADYLMSFLATLKKIIGGRIGSYERVIERARREATVRILREAQSQGYDAVCNIRLETTDLIGSRNKNKKKAAAMASVYVYGTAYKRA